MLLQVAQAILSRPCPAYALKTSRVDNQNIACLIHLVQVMYHIHVTRLCVTNGYADQTGTSLRWLLST